MTTALVRRELGRPRLESLVYGQTILDSQLAGELLERLDPERISVALRSLLEQVSMCEGAIEEITTSTKGQRELTDRALALTLEDVRGCAAFSIDTLVALVNQLPPVRAMPTPAWQQDLEAGLSTSSEA